MSETIEFAANGKTASGYLARPASGKGRGVLVIQEWWGLNDHVKAVADRFAREGFLALAPDLYHGTVTKSPDEAGKLLMALNIDQAERDLRGAAVRLRELSGGPVGTVGFCMGGALSLFAACKAGADVAACVVYYGGHPKVSYDFDALKAPVLGHWAEDDGFANANVPLIRGELEKRGKPFEFHSYPGTKHAFFNDTRPEVYHRQAAELSFERTLAFFRQKLA
ncbi:MAG: dienelactone hydrolase family protein [Vicinamibacteria bacterium]